MMDLIKTHFPNPKKGDLIDPHLISLFPEERCPVFMKYNLKVRTWHQRL